MKKDILEKGAILQRDRESYTIAPHIPGELPIPRPCARSAMWPTIRGAVDKLTSAQRIALIGIRKKARS